MKSKLIKFLIAAAVMASLSMTAQAIPITGQISLSGSASSDNSDLTVATTLSNFTGVVVGGVPSGTYAGLAGTAVSMPNPVIFRPITVPINKLWTFTVGATTYDFILNTMSIGAGNDANDLTLKGTGTLEVTGFDSTAGNWTLTAQTYGATAFTFSSSNVAVPDGGTTVLLLGAALSALGLIKRRLS